MDFDILKPTEELQQERAAAALGVSPTFNYRPEVGDTMAARLGRFFTELDSVVSEDAPEILRAHLEEASYTVSPHFEDRAPLRWQQLLMWRIRVDDEGRPYVNHCGTVAGFNACLIIYREDDLIVAVTDNAWSTGLSTARAFADLFRD